MKMPKKPILFIFIFLFALLIANFAFGFEVKYPNIPGVGTPENCAPKECLGQYVAYWFTFGIYIAGVLALISLAIGGIQIITSAGNPEAMGNAKDRIKGAVLGLVLLLGSVIILRTINPQFIEPTITPLPGVAGIFLQKGTDELSPAPQSISDVSIFPAIQEGYNKLFYKCSEDGGGDGPTLLIWKFPKQGFQGNDNNYSGVQVVRKNCGESESIGNSGSYQIAFESPGVYYFLEDGCNGHMSSVNVASQDRIQEPFLGRIKSVRVVGNYGVILHEAIGLENGGRCLFPMTEERCHDAKNIVARSADIFKVRQTDFIRSGDGVDLYNFSQGWDVISRDTLKIEIKNTEINPIYRKKATDVKYLPPVNPFCLSFQHCPGSVRMKGDYLIGIFSFVDQNQSNNPFLQEIYAYCQTFTENITNFNKTQVYEHGTNFFDELIIIATEK
jgi:hypothetical protein